MPADSLDQIVSLCKRRGFIFPGSAVYGGLANSWDYGPLGVELKNNVKRAWWDSVVYQRDDVEGMDCAIIMNRKVWHYSGHEATFNDPLVDNKATKKRYRLDHLLAAQTRPVMSAVVQEVRTRFAPTDTAMPRLTELLGVGDEYLARVFEHHVDDLISAVVNVLGGKPDVARECLIAAKVVDAQDGKPGDWTEPRQFNLMFDTTIGPVRDEDNMAYLRPETAQGIFVNFKHVLDTMRRKLPFGIAQIGKSFRNEITPGNFTFRTREFEQMEIEYFVAPGDDDLCHEQWVHERFAWYIEHGISRERLRKRQQGRGELAHYAKACTDIEYKFPGSLGFSEVEGIANRTDFDLTAHSREVPNDADARARLKLPANPDSVENLTYFDQDAKTHIVPYVIEPSAGADRITLAFLAEAFNIENVKQVPDEEQSKVREQIEMFLRSVERSEALTETEKAEFEVAGMEIMARGPDAYPAMASLLAAPAAEKIQVSKKVRGVIEKVLEEYFRTVLKLDPRLAPIKAAILPLKKNEPRIVEVARRIRQELQQQFRVVYDDTGAIGKLYRRQDEIGTPMCVTVDFQSLEDHTVTVRDRDSMSQERISIADLRAYMDVKLSGHYSRKLHPHETQRLWRS